MGYHCGSAVRGYNNYNRNRERNVNLNNEPSNGLGMTLLTPHRITSGDLAKTYRHLYSRLCSYENLMLAYAKARRGKTLKEYVIEFEDRLEWNILKLKYELETFTYSPSPMTTFIVRDPKTRKISASHFRDRVVHHAICNIIEPILGKGFIYDSFANQKGKGTHVAIKRFEKFARQVCYPTKTKFVRWGGAIKTF